MRTGVGKASVTCLKVQGSETPKEFGKLTGLTDWAQSSPEGSVGVGEELYSSVAGGGC